MKKNNFFYQLSQIPFYRQGPSSLQEAMRQEVIFQRVAASEFLLSAGMHPQHLIIPLTNSLRVYHLSEKGKELTLYPVMPGELCSLNVLSIITNNPFPAYSLTNSRMLLALFPEAVFRHWFETFEIVRNHCLHSIAAHFLALVNLLEEIAFHKVEFRIARRLLERWDPMNGEITITHERLARELGTSREVVSRALEEMKKEGAVELKRGAIQIIRPERLPSITRKISNHTNNLHSFNKPI